MIVKQSFLQLFHHKVDMNTEYDTSRQQPPPSARDAAYRKLRISAWVMKVLLLGYAGLSFWRFVPWWLNEQGVKAYVSQRWGCDVSTLEAWQRFLGLGLNLVVWGFLVAAVVYAWQFFNGFQRTKRLTDIGGTQLMRCAWFAIASISSNSLVKPLNSYIQTLHLEAAARQLEWQLTQLDILASIFCLSLLMFAYVHRWMLDIAQENAQFI
jgi:hypothetical protein